MEEPGTALLQLRGISKRFGAVQALSEVDLECRAGEVVGLVGDNGAGKTTLIKVVAGTHAPDQGQVLFGGREVRIDSPLAAARLGIATVYQDLALCDNLDAVANLYIGRERGRGLGRNLRWLDEAAMAQGARALFARLSVEIPNVRTDVAALSGGQRQSIAVARATMGDPKLVILDEPTAALGVTQTHQVLDLVKRLREEGLGVVMISHSLLDVFAVADRIVVLRLGRRVASFAASSTTAEEVVAAITGARAADVHSAFAPELS